MTKPSAVVTICFGLVVILLTIAGEAHKGVTSKFTYNGDIHQIFLNRCSGCHVDGGVAPMSLMTYEDAFPWAEALRAELLGTSGSTASLDPAADVEATDSIKAAHRQISARELDMVLDWATGGTPEGDKARTPAPVVFSNDWPQGRPDVIVALTPRVVPAEISELTYEFSAPVPVSRGRDVDRFSFRPGAPAIVRTATVSLRSKGGHVRLIGRWHPQQVPTALTLQPPLRLEPGSVIVARIHYKKTWKLEGQAVTDESRIGFYAAD